MFDIGFLELTFVAIIALIVLGPERLPVAARTVGRWIGKARRTFNSVKSEIDRELQLDELKRQLAEQQQRMDQFMNARPLDDLTEETQRQIEESKAEFYKEMNEQNESDANKDKEEIEEMSGCENPVEFEPLPTNSSTDKKTSDDRAVEKPTNSSSSENTIHPEPTKKQSNT
ncbi:Sec-independent protein translocase protein TatB [Pleionea sediminis]|uniref:Sec-independent protein translocase protein TatB n=1 Tax=Pleionea sediminis TaxID=2569479 RepID=UPI001184A510|nr:Sec-independent protein translocase protein TatB [Pleionea sediminis]